MSDAIKVHQRAIRDAHGVAAHHIEAVLVREISKKRVAWEGVVDVYNIDGHPKAKRCYAWSYVQDGQIITVTLLEIPPVCSPQTAVKAAIAVKARKQRRSS
jgi:hypothetical protein